MKGIMGMINNEFINRELLLKKDDLNDFFSEKNNSLTNDELIMVITELVNKNNRQENFLLNISHDLRGHLNVILSIMQCIDYGSVSVNDKKALEYMGIVKRNSLKMLKLINNLIDTTKLENNYYVLNKKNIDVISMIESTVSCIDKYAKQKNIQLTFDTNEEECIMSVDPEVLDRIIMNLLSNAIKFSYSNTNVYINMNVLEDSVKISIRDEGPGISKDNQEKIFSRFYQIASDSNMESSGSGIGLDLVNYLVKSMDGDIFLNSEENKGCEFIITLPITFVEEKDDYCIRSDGNKIQMLEVEFSDLYKN
ncbi:Alkaline phosphatase synthesis sensor protein PhoR [Clostridium tertium]|uniref:histidine kinase n=2 Tax=Clostridium tertium TaxID=1559 RepID=A0A6N3C7R4_9CLOT